MPHRPEDYDSRRWIQWCPGCGNYAILVAFRQALAELDLDPEEIVVITGIGCYGRMNNYVVANGFHVIHGRPIPVATGVKLANPRLTVYAFSGDGDAYAIGISHLPHVARRNVGIKLIVHNNAVYGLTRGQVSPTSPKGMRTKTTPKGAVVEPINPIALVLASGATFVARGFAGDVQHLKYLIVEATRHRGFAFIDILQPCVTYNYIYTYQYFRQRVYKLEDEGHDPTDFNAAWEKAWEWGDRIPIGIIYRREDKPALEEVLPALKEKPLVEHNLEGIDVKKLLDEHTI